MNNQIAPKSIRLVNCIIDILAITVISTVIVFISNTREDSDLIIIPVFLLYYLLLEGIFGQTIGKLITGCKISYLKKRNRWFWLLARTFLRLNPFNHLSFLFGLECGTHDVASLTRVVMIED